MGKSRVYYRLAEAQACPTDDPDNLYITAEEITRQDGSVGRCYRAFDSFPLFLRHREMFPHTHELMVQHSEATLDTSGRLVFDFDLPLQIPEGFPRHVETIIHEVVERNYGGVQPPAPSDYVWSRSPSTVKTSLHLTVKNLFWQDWIIGCRLFYALFSQRWDETYGYLSAEQVLDHQVIRRHASLRMVGSSKIGGRRLELVHRPELDIHHTLTDSMIRVLLPEDRERERVVELEYLSDRAQEILDTLQSSGSPPRHRHRSLQPDRCPGEISELSQQAWDIYLERGYDHQYAPDYDQGGCLYLRRIASGRCPVSGRRHDSENAYLAIVEEDDGDDEDMVIYFRCWRGCQTGSGHHSVKVGRIGGDDHKAAHLVQMQRH